MKHVLWMKESTFWSAFVFFPTVWILLAAFCNGNMHPQQIKDTNLSKIILQTKDIDSNDIRKVLQKHCVL